MNIKTIALALSLVTISGVRLSAQAGNTSGGARYEINLFGGGSFFNRQNNQPHQDQANGGVAGFRFTQNFWNYISLEQTGTVHAVANTVYRIPATQNDYSFGTRMRQFHFNPVFHFKPRESRIRPFVTAGFGMDYFNITEEARRQVGNGVNTPFQQITNLESTWKLAFNYGAGLKAALSDRVGLRFDVRGFATGSPDHGVLGVAPPGAIAFTRSTPVQHFQTTGGVIFMLGNINQGPVCEFRPGSIDPANLTIWTGQNASFNLPVSNSCLGVTPKYRWSLNGNETGTDNSLTLTNPPAGTHQIKAVVEADTTGVTDRKTRNFLKKFPIPAAERSATLTVKPRVIELASVVADPSTINHNGTSRITSTIRYEGPDAGEEITLRYSATGGSITPTEAKLNLKPGNNTHTATYSAAGLNLQPGGPARSVTINAETGGNTKSVSLSVTAPPAPPVAAPPPPRPQAQQMDDVVFARGSARANNCAKRILDQVFERAASMPDFDILLVGHYDAVEKNIKVRDRKTRKTRSLDEERVLNVAAVLSAGVEPCKRLERSRIKVAYVGSEQLSPFRTSLCEATVKERAGSKITARDGNAKNRRVEIWMVPKGGPMPNGIAGIQDAPVADIQSKGCPR